MGMILVLGKKWSIELRLGDASNDVGTCSESSKRQPPRLEMTSTSMVKWTIVGETFEDKQIAMPLIMYKVFVSLPAERTWTVPSMG